MIKLWYSNFTRSNRARWILEELGVPYQLVNVDMKAKEHKAPGYIAEVHPHGSVPACEIDGVHIIESGAIIMTLADKFADKALAPKSDAPERATYNQWFFYGYATLENAVVDVLTARRAPKEGEAPMAEDKKAKAEERWRDVSSFVDRTLAGKSWIMGANFSAADCVIAALMIWAASAKLCDGLPNVAAYVDRAKSRPAYTRARKDA